MGYLTSGTQCFLLLEGEEAMQGEGARKSLLSHCFIENGNGVAVT